jgi:hypothetical protein
LLVVSVAGVPFDILIDIVGLAPAGTDATRFFVPVNVLPYPCSVVAQNADFSLQLNPDDTSISGTGLQNVKVRGGASTTWRVSPRARCWLAFDDGDPSRPFVGGFMGASSDVPGEPLSLGPLTYAGGTMTASASSRSSCVGQS